MRKLIIVFWWGASFIIISCILEFISRFVDGKWYLWCNEVSNHFMFVGLPLLMVVVYLRNDYTKE